jgi:hypothetical protein
MITIHAHERISEEMSRRTETLLKVLESQAHFDFHEFITESEG